MHTQVYIGLGSNLENSIEHVSTAVAEIARLPNTSLVKASAVYKSIAIGPENQPDYINAAVHIETKFAPEELLNELQNIENKHQRKRELRWGPRTLDLDILLFNNLTIANERLTVPHKEMCNRNFVLQPLLDLNSNLCLPDGRKLADILPIIGLHGLTRLDEISLVARCTE